jgi:hypothetical protein
MMRRIVVMFAAASCAVAMMAPLACGKYGRPERVSSQLQQPAQVEAGDLTAGPGREDARNKRDEKQSRKP